MGARCLFSVVNVEAARKPTIRYLFFYINIKTYICSFIQTLIYEAFVKVRLFSVPCKRDTNDSSILQPKFLGSYQCGSIRAINLHACVFAVQILSNKIWILARPYYEQLKVAHFEIYRTSRTFLDYRIEWRNGSLVSLLQSSLNKIHGAERYFHGYWYIRR